MCINDLLPNASDRCRSIWSTASTIARFDADGAIQPEHILLAIVAHPKSLAMEALRRCGVDFLKLATLIQPHGSVREDERAPMASARALEVISLAKGEALKLNHKYLGSEHILLGILLEGGTACKALADVGANFGNVRRAIIAIIGP